MSTLAKRSRTWSTNDVTVAEPSSGRESDPGRLGEPDFDSVHGAQLETEHQAKSFDVKIYKMKVRLLAVMFLSGIASCHGDLLQNGRPFFVKARFLFPLGILGLLVMLHYFQSL